MHRNTFLLLSILAVIAALLIGVNIGKKLSSSSSSFMPTPTTILVSPTLVAEQTITFQSDRCGFSLEYSSALTKIDSSSDSAILVNPDKTGESVIITCQKQIPRVPLPSEKIETVQIGSVSAKLYHDASAKDGTPIDKLIFTNPSTGYDIFIAGLGATFQKVIKTVQIF